MYINEYYSDLVSEKLGSDDISSVKLKEQIQIKAEIGKIDKNKLSLFKNLIHPLLPRAVIRPEKKNKSDW